MNSGVYLLEIEDFFCNLVAWRKEQVGAAGVFLFFGRVGVTACHAYVLPLTARFIHGFAILLFSDYFSVRQ
ncbi:hypothetical protein N665_0017s0026 [Sinapis alba]|nr:hypothetical protein N665_0017s0026 [Sinapis alba]